MLEVLKDRLQSPKIILHLSWNIKPSCPVNLCGTSQAMEGSAAVVIWKRSVDRNQLVYSTYIGDGDSSSFKNLLSSDPYQGKELVRKEECLGHVQKRLKKHLKKKSHAFPKLSPAKVERVDQLFALVVVQNRGKSPTDIQAALLNLLEHLVKTMTTVLFQSNHGVTFRSVALSTPEIQLHVYLLFVNPTSLILNTNARRKCSRPLLPFRCAVR